MHGRKYSVLYLRYLRFPAALKIVSRHAARRPRREDSGEPQSSQVSFVERSVSPAGAPSEAHLLGRQYQGQPPITRSPLVTIAGRA